MVLPPAWVRRAIQDRRALHDKAERGPLREYYKHSYLHITTVTITAIHVDVHNRVTATVLGRFTLRLLVQFPSIILD